MKILGVWVRLPDGREGHVAASGIDGLVVIVQGRMVTVKPSDATVIPVPPPLAADLPEPVRTAQRPIQTHHPLDEMPAHNLSVLVSGKWSEPQ
jgi:hypothetical protein